MTTISNETFVENVLEAARKVVMDRVVDMMKIRQETAMKNCEDLEIEQAWMSGFNAAIAACNITVHDLPLDLTDQHADTSPPNF